MQRGVTRAPGPDERPELDHRGMHGAPGRRPAILIVVFQLWHTKGTHRSPLLCHDRATPPRKSRGDERTADDSPSLVRATLTQKGSVQMVDNAATVTTEPTTPARVFCPKCGGEKGDEQHAWCRECQAEAKRERRALDRVREKLDAAGEGSWTPRSGVHCARCRYPAGLWTPPLDERGFRLLASDPRGWAPGHGLESGTLCCRQRVCYDARPGHRAWLPDR